jgi:predicted N-formylglutamate amidohydrolase
MSTTDLNNWPVAVADYRTPDVESNNDILITCEHASNELPSPYKWSASDSRDFKNAHWAWDIGAKQMSLELAEEMKVMCIYAKYSRLLCDVNRHITADTLFRKQGDGKIVDLNKNVDQLESLNRITKYYVPYYYTLKEKAAELKPKFVFSVHSFTPVYEGKQREVEIGILFNRSEELSEKICKGLQERRWVAKLNEPYSGKDGIYTVDSLVEAGNPSERTGLEFEFRNDLLQDVRTRERLKKDVVEVLKNVGILPQ